MRANPSRSELGSLQLFCSRDLAGSEPDLQPGRREEGGRGDGGREGKEGGS